MTSGAHPRSALRHHAILIGLVLIAGCVEGTTSAQPFKMTAPGESRSVAWPITAGSLAFDLEYNISFAEATGFYLVNLRADGITALVDGLEADQSHLARGPAPAHVGAGDVRVEAPEVLGGNTGRAVGHQEAVPLGEGLLVMCWGRGNGDVRFDAKGPVTHVIPDAGEAQAWTVRDLEGGVRVRGGPATAGFQARVEAKEEPATLLSVVVITSDGSSGEVIVSSPTQRRAVSFSPQAGAPDLVRHQVWVYSRDSLTVNVSMAGDNTETKLFITSCSVPAIYESEVWAEAKRSIAPQTARPQDPTDPS